MKETYLDPRTDWDAVQPMREFFFNTDSINLDWFALNVYEQKITVAMRGFVEYTTVGTVYRRDFAFSWKGMGGQTEFSWLSAALRPLTTEIGYPAGIGV